MIDLLPTARFRPSCGLRGGVFVWLLAVMIVLGGLNTAHALGEAELLPEHEAFAFSAELLPDQRLEVRWNIADGYYMYRDKMGFEVLGGNALSGPLSLPEGKPKDDALFGEVDVYTEQFVMRLPLASESAEFILLVQGQGCNEPVGVCYPPMQHEIRFDSAISGAITPDRQPTTGVVDTYSPNTAPFGNQSGQSTVPGLANQDGTSSLSAAGKPASGSRKPAGNPAAGNFDQSEFLAVDDAFRLTVIQSGADSLLAHFDIADGYYLYRDKTSFRSSGSAGVKSFKLPPGEPRDDPYFGRSMVFPESLDIPISLSKVSPDGGPLTVVASYQGCAVDGICYAPATKAIDLELMSRASAASAASAISGTTSKQLPGALPGILLGALFAGLLLTFTPCVLPMIPILSSVISGQGESLTKSRGALLAVTYVLGTAVTYAAMGAIAGATGEQLQAYFQNAWAVGILITVLVVMALSMFGLFQIQVPAAIQTRLQSSSRKFTGSMPLVFILGLVSALIVGACVSPILISFLGLAMSRADPVLGAQMMFAMAIGMGLPLIALGLGAGHLLPRAGPWMEVIKHTLGVMLIAVAIYLLGIFPKIPILLVWGAFLIIVSSYIGLGKSENGLGPGWHKLGRGLAIILLVWGIAAMAGGFAGQRDLFRPLPAQLLPDQGNKAGSATEQPLFTRLHTPEELQQQFSLASTTGKKVMIDFYADWCVDCIKMEKTTFRDPRVRGILDSNYLALQVDVTNPNDPGPRAIKNKLGVFGPPAVLFFDRNGTSLADRDFYGYMNPDEFLALIDD